jgi:hypothetical protein
LPGTAEANGFTAEKAKGNLVSVAAGQAFSCSYSFGALDQKAATLLQSQCNTVKST